METGSGQDKAGMTSRSAESRSPRKTSSRPASRPATTGDKPRPMVAAANKGPGPAIYTLPSTIGASSHNLTTRSLPAFSFGSRPNTTCLIENWRQPGPLYNLNPKVCRKGVVSGPCYTMSAKYKPLEPSPVPSPTTYSPEKSMRTRENRQPAFTMSMRLIPLTPESSHKPSPSTYSLPSTLGGSKIYGGRTSPQHRMAGRLAVGNAMDDLCKTPGIASYTLPSVDTMGRKSPKFSMSSKAYMPPEGTLTPGPGAHAPEKVQVTTKRAPAYSLGVRHSEYAADNLSDTRYFNLSATGIPA